MSNHRKNLTEFHLNRAAKEDHRVQMKMMSVESSQSMWNRGIQAHQGHEIAVLGQKNHLWI